jgi:hypothetical protein
MPYSALITKIKPHNSELRGRHNRHITRQVLAVRLRKERKALKPKCGDDLTNDDRSLSNPKPGFQLDSKIFRCMQSFSSESGKPAIFRRAEAMPLKAPFKPHQVSPILVVTVQVSEIFRLTSDVPVIAISR